MCLRVLYYVRVRVRVRVLYYVRVCVCVSFIMCVCVNVPPPPTSMAVQGGRRYGPAPAGDFFGGTVYGVLCASENQYGSELDGISWWTKGSIYSVQNALEARTSGAIMSHPQ